MFLLGECLHFPSDKAFAFGTSSPDCTALPLRPKNNTNGQARKRRPVTHVALNIGVIELVSSLQGLAVPWRSCTEREGRGEGSVGIPQKKLEKETKHLKYKEMIPLDPNEASLGALRSQWKRMFETCPRHAIHHDSP